MTTWSNDIKNSSTFTNDNKSDAETTAQTLLIGDGFELLLDTTYKLLIQTVAAGTVWNNDTKS